MQPGRSRLGPHFFDEFPAFLDVGVDPLPVLVIVGESRVHVRQRDRRIRRHDFIGAHAHPFVPDGYVLDRDAVAVDAGPAAARTGGAHDSHAVPWRAARRLAGLSLTLGGCRFHGGHCITGCFCLS